MAPGCSAHGKPFLRPEDQPGGVACEPNIFLVQQNNHPKAKVSGLISPTGLRDK